MPYKPKNAKPFLNNEPLFMQLMEHTMLTSLITNQELSVLEEKTSFRMPLLGWITKMWICCITVNEISLPRTRIRVPSQQSKKNKPLPPKLLFLFIFSAIFLVHFVISTITSWDTLAPLVVSRRAGFARIFYRSPKLNPTCKLQPQVFHCRFL